MGVIAVFDTVGIQNYIFSSNKLAENVGGSKLVADIFGKLKLLPKVISSVTGQPLTDWSEGNQLDPELKAEIVYQGGGNAYAAFKDEQTFQEVTKMLLIRVNKTAPGVGIAIAAVETDFGDTYKSDYDRLNKRLILAKGGFNIPALAMNQPITKQSERTGLPVSFLRNDEYLSESQVRKRVRYIKYKKNERGSNNKEKGEKGIEDFDDLAFDKDTDSLIAIIHADGNNMGKLIKSHMEQFKTYAEAVPEIRKLSDKISKCYKAALCRTITAFNAAYPKYVEDQRAKYPTKTFSDKPPILQLIGDGDDTTLVIGGRFALDFAVRLLREIEKTPAGERPFEDTPSACAGVVLFHSHYPFSEAYKLAEELCHSAKKPSRKYPGSYIDFHLHQSGSVSGLHRLRERQYMVDGQTILRRPWRVTDGLADMLPNFKWFEENVGMFKENAEGTEKMPRNKTKAIRNAISAGDNAASAAEKRMIGAKLPAFPLGQEAGMSRYAPYFDILEMCDAYENLLNGEDSRDVE